MVARGWGERDSGYLMDTRLPYGVIECSVTREGMVVQHGECNK